MKDNHFTLFFSTPKHRVRANKSCKELYEKYRALFYIGGNKCSKSVKICKN